MEITTERVSIPLAGGGKMGGYLARPKSGGPHPAVLVYMEIFGVNAHIRDVAERVAREGYVALAPDYFHRTGPGVEYGYDDAGIAGGMKLLGAAARGRDDRGREGGDRLAAHAQGRARRPHRRDGLLHRRPHDVPDGLRDRRARGGELLRRRHRGARRARRRAVDARPHGEDPRQAPRVSSAARTRMIPKSQVDAIRAALAKHEIRHEVVVYPDADHGFFCDQRAHLPEGRRRGRLEAREAAVPRRAGLSASRGAGARGGSRQSSISRRSAEKSDSTEVSRAFSPIRPTRQMRPASAAEPAAHLDAVALEQAPPQRGFLARREALGQPQRREHREPVARIDERPEAERADAFDQRFAGLAVAGDARLHAFLFDHLERLGEAQDHRDRRRVVVDALASEVGAEQPDVEIPALDRACGARARARGPPRRSSRARGPGGQERHFCVPL